MRPELSEMIKSSMPLLGAGRWKQPDNIITLHSHSRSSGLVNLVIFFFSFSFAEEKKKTKESI